MRPVIALFLTFLVAFTTSPVLGGTYNLPSHPDYNNIGLHSELYLTLNVTLVNTGPFPKFVLVNPRYDFVVHRGYPGNESYKSFLVGDTVYYSLGNSWANTLNYYIGFWIHPHEVVVVEFRIIESNPLVIDLKDYVSLCGEYKITEVTLENGNVTGHVNTKDDLGNGPFCDVIYPQLLNTPKFIDPTILFPIRDPSIKILNYWGTVGFRVENVPGQYGNFRTLFAIAPPVLFKDAEHYAFTPNYTMTYREYVNDFLPEYLGIEPMKEGVSLNVTPDLVLYELTDSLITLGKIKATLIQGGEMEPIDFPIWIVWLGADMNIGCRKLEFEISYRFRWEIGD
ncbi:hypothetical protein [Pyrococcus yayanosii]|uniref:Uncharacterized protein n=1 Tax=Pyrococcus yayanosii (strain CH1 / JCM 16557) TaxID=529709 RepID=F8AEN5_PYRYC|nr:hypothetical protein [Pyrococcus yayanosii]AEH24715.1 hypothetical protein PYCH_10320 [Pyrococcus yayanosii CH1]